MNKSSDYSGMYLENSWRRRLITKGDALVKSRILSWVDPVPTHLFLDIGAGRAEFSLEIANKVGCNQVHILDAVDFSGEWMKLAEITSIDFKGKVHDLADPLPYPDDMFDIILSNQVVEHLYDPIFHLSEIKRVLSPKGYAIIGTCNLSSVQYRLELLFGRTPRTLTVGLYKYEPKVKQETPQVTRFARHISCLTFRDFKHLLQSLGFCTLQARTSVIYVLPSFIERMVTRVLPIGNYMTFKVARTQPSLR